MTVVERALERAIAEAKARVREIGGANCGPRVATYLAAVGLSPGHPWCAAFVSWCFLQAERDLDLLCPIRPSARALGLWEFAHPDQRRSNPERGAIFIIDHGGGLGHCGIVEEVALDWLRTVEGNTNAAGGREGDGVYQKSRHRNEINVGYIVA